ncbi:hypothetical protein XENTR_v10023500 [Xenopus tropicalis]|nr:hypothetical protein XENTR_v10023500 [Xenopus tropicalis]
MEFYTIFISIQVPPSNKIIMVSVAMFLCMMGLVPIASGAGFRGFGYMECLLFTPIADAFISLCGNHTVKLFYTSGYFWRGTLTSSAIKRRISGNRNKNPWKDSMSCCFMIDCVEHFFAGRKPESNVIMQCILPSKCTSEISRWKRFDCTLRACTFKK